VTWQRLAFAGAFQVTVSFHKASPFGKGALKNLPNLYLDDSMSFGECQQSGYPFFLGFLRICQ
jgi:hypothetical protein